MKVNGKYRYPPLGFVVPSSANVRSMYRKLAGNPPVHLCLVVLNGDKFGVLLTDTLGKPREHGRVIRLLPFVATSEAIVFADRQRRLLLERVQTHPHMSSGGTEFHHLSIALFFLS